MNLRHLIIFKTVCEQSSITKAAEKLYMTQPAVSHVISELEKEIGTNLFDRISRKIFLNESGKIFLTKTIELLKLYDNLQEGLSDLKQYTPIRIGSSITIANFWLSDIIKNFENIYKNISLKITIDNAKEIESKLIQNKIDIALIEGIISNKYLIKEGFSSYNLAVICSKEHFFASKKLITINELIKEKLLLREKGSAIRDSFDSALLLHDILIEPMCESVNSQALIQLVKKNIGISILPEKLIKKELLLNEIVKINVENLHLKIVNHIVFHKDKYQSESFKKFILLCTNTFKNINY